MCTPNSKCRSPFVPLSRALPLLPTLSDNILIITLREIWKNYQPRKLFMSERIKFSWVFFKKFLKFAHRLLIFYWSSLIPDSSCKKMHFFRSYRNQREVLGLAHIADHFLYLFDKLTDAQIIKKINKTISMIKYINAYINKIKSVSVTANPPPQRPWIPLTRPNRTRPTCEYKLICNIYITTCLTQSALVVADYQIITG